MSVDIGVVNFSAASLYHSQTDIARFREQNKSGFNREKLQDFLLGRENVLDAESIANECFPDVHADIFLSHSHRDEDDVIRLALSLEKMGLKVFVDSCIWGWADEILKVIDKKFCYRKSSQTFDYDLRNRTTSNVYMILNSALQSMIARTELLLFLQTSNSVKIGEYVEDKTHLSSPWIFSELMFAKLGQRTKRRTVAKYAFESLATDSRGIELNKNIDVAFPHPGTRYELKNSLLLNWINEAPPQSLHDDLVALSYLDKLYQYAGIPKHLLEESRSIFPRER
ncbi:toll/interleukin-1 receptor domain-containing protein [Serratia fonticola]|uniref:toll/interleukin-1 receptor domain-containing protein n=1 Tax=Serratia fonticola TaxID=47917 RepID=UPI00217B087F|nr:toll/interleukin-1 receptor domain-containing protein [Serratia fonticola]CAI1661158.1 Uncharacterised protein [Serratia fonticola]